MNKRSAGSACFPFFHFRPFALFLFLLPLLSQEALAVNVVDALLQPFAGFKLNEFYAQFATIIDFTLFLVLFLGLAKATLGKHFSGRSGNYIQVALALVLSISLVLYERTAGFNLASFGPFAAVVLFSVTGFFIYGMVKRMGAGTSWSASLGFIIAYFMIQAIAPEIHNWLATKASVLAGLLSIAVLVTALRLGISVFSLLKSPAVKIAEKVAESRKEEMAEIIPEEKLRQEGKEIQTQLQGIAERAYKQEKDIMANMREVAGAVQKYGDEPEALALLGRKMLNLFPKQHNLLKALEELKAVDAGLLKHDIQNEKLFQQAARDYSKIPGKMRAGLRNELKMQREKLDVESSISKLEHEADAVVKNIEYCISQAVGALDSQRPDTAYEWLMSAIKKEKQAATLISKIRRFSRKLKGMVQKQVALAQVMEKVEA